MSDGLSAQLSSLRAIVVEAEAARARDGAEITRLTDELAGRTNELAERTTELNDRTTDLGNRNETIVSMQQKGIWPEGWGPRPGERPLWRLPRRCAGSRTRSSTRRSSPHRHPLPFEHDEPEPADEAGSGSFSSGARDAPGVVYSA